MEFKRIFRCFIYGIALFTSTYILEAQNVPTVEVEISTQKVLIGGKPYYLHTVKKGQTLYSIARAYRCTVNEILQYNNLTDEIKVDQVIKVPVKDVTSEPTDKGSSVVHTVMQGQTLFSIARNYGVSVEDIRQANQLTSDTLRVSQQLVIPVNRKTDVSSKDTPAIVDKRFIIHRIQAGETLYSLAKLYGTTVDKILEINPDQRESLKVGAELKIPPTDSTLIIPKTVISCDSLKFLVKGKSISIALLLPLFANNQGSKGDEDEESREEMLISSKVDENFPPVVMNFVEFYQGVLLAIEDLKKEGLNIELNVFDTRKGTDNINTILSQPAFQRSQLIIGPVFSDQIPMVASYARQNRVPVVLPVTAADSIVEQTNNMFQILSGQKGQIQQILKAVEADSVRNILVVYNAKDNPLYNQQIRKQLTTLFNNTTVAKKIREFNIYGNDFNDLLASLDSVTMNHVVSFSNDEVFVATLLGQLEKKLLYYPIHTYGMSEWLSFNSIDLNYFYNQQLTCFSNFYVNYQDEKVLRFLKKYRLRFGSEPVRNSKFGFNYCMLGYDLTRYFVTAVTCLGSNFNAYDCTPYPAMNVKLKFESPIGTGGYVNRAFYRLQYNKNFTFLVE
ncbi:MAG: LysM peptidoglycan-binding domain-containing protein [Bacteroidales bacterium]